MSPRHWTERSTLGRVIRAGPENPSLVVHASLLRCIAVAAFSGPFVWVSVYLLSGADGDRHGPELVGRLFGLGGLLLFAPGMYLSLRTLLPGPVIGADAHGVAVKPWFGAIRSAGWDQLDHCHSTGSGLIRGVSFAWAPRAGSMSPDGGSVQVFSGLLPVRAGDLKDEIEALRRYYHDRKMVEAWSAAGSPPDIEVPAAGVYLDMVDLPPRPDRDTGLPAPPRPPGDVALDRKEHAGTDPTPEPPPGQGRTLFHQGGDSVGCLATGCVLVLAVPVTFAEGTRWMTDPVLWAIVVGFPVALVLSTRSRGCAVGAGWLATGTRWVDVYAVEDVNRYTVLGDEWLRMRDSRGRRLRVKTEELRKQPEMWGLVYNGLLHSVITGRCRPGHRNHRLLRLPYPGGAAQPAAD